MTLLADLEDFVTEPPAARPTDRDHRRADPERLPARSRVPLGVTFERWITPCSVGSTAARQGCLKIEHVAEPLATS